MELVHYLRIVRRRWRTVLAFLVVGVLIGLGSAIITGNEKPTTATFYLAKHTLISSDGTANLAKDQALASEQEVPKRVAQKLGYDSPATVASKVTIEARPDVNLLYVAAGDTDPKKAVLVADTFAEQLVLYLQDISVKQQKDRIAAIDNQIRSLQDEYDQLKGDTDPAHKDQNGSRMSDISKKISDLKFQKTQAEASPAATETLTTLSTADAVPVSQATFDALLNSQTKASPSNSPTANATKPSAIDAALRSSGGFGPVTRGAIGGAIGLLLGMALVIVLDRIDPRIRTKFEAEEAFGWPVIGEVPPLTRSDRHAMKVISFDQPRSRAAEAYRVLRSALMFVSTGDEASPDDHPIFATTPAAPAAEVEAEASGEGTAAAADTSEQAPATPAPPASSNDGMAAELADDAAGSGTPGTPSGVRGQVIMITSPGPSEGKTTTVANLAAILAETGKSVLVINCDFRRPRVHLYLGTVDEPRKVVETEVPGVKLVSQVLENPNDANPAEVVHTQRQVVRNAREMFDLVLLDTAPLLTTNDATEILSVADQVVVVARTGKTHKEAADRSAELLERRNAPVVGVVLVGATDVPTARYYYYGDNPDRQEPEPGEETENPLAELVGSADEPPRRASDRTDGAAAENTDNTEDVEDAEKVMTSEDAEAPASEPESLRGS